MPKISVIVPVYNVAPYLERGLECLLNQTLEDIEIICIDDCSTDGSLSILRNFEQKDSRIKVIALDKNHGVSYARNKGLDIMQGEYVSFMDSDDKINPDYMEKLYIKAKEGNYDIVKCQKEQLNLDGTITIGGCYKRILNYGLYAFYCEWASAIYKTSIIQENHIRIPESISVSEDFVFLNKIVCKSKSIATVPDVYYYYLKREGSLYSDIFSLQKIKEALLAVEIILFDLNNTDLYKNDPEMYARAFMWRFNLIFLKCFSCSEPKEAKKLCAESIMKNFYKCKDIDGLKRIYKYKRLLKCIEKKDTKEIEALLNRYANTDEFAMQNSFWEDIFSLKNTRGKRSKIVTILGCKFEFKKKTNNELVNSEDQQLQ